MGDADKAQFNGVKNVFGGGAEYTYLMSFYPVVAKGSFGNWQIFSTPVGFTSTNNPCETFNRDFKRDYSQKRKLKLAVRLDQARYCCSHQSMSPVAFAE
ncbi:hypothetical protein F443_07608 [Phytophthora nicotianae P1569]|uniref:Uncharacterized protein n=1 Tax=Phytophthora nicotianae P1569 TaxID=1317065 RepID=V9FC62_PHYNI|nr:hypothetical protein F443_07608 [Phytophthora nicotianae P1569]